MIYVVNDDANRVAVINGKTKSLLNVIATNNYSPGEINGELYNSSSVAVNPAMNTVYVTNPQSNIISVIDGKTNDVTKSIVTGTSQWGLAVNPVTNLLYSTNVKSNTVSVINSRTNSIVIGPVVGSSNHNERGPLAAIDVDEFPSSIAVNPNTNAIYLSYAVSKKISLIDGKTDNLINTITVGKSNASSFSSRIAFDPDRNLAFVIDSDSSSVAEIEGSGKIIGWIECKNCRTVAELT